MSKINLIPEVRQQKLKVQKTNAMVTTSAIAVVVGLLAIVLSMAAYAGVLTAQKVSAEKDIATTQDSLDTMKDLATTVANLEKGLANIKQIIAGSKDWNNLFGVLEKSTPNDVQIVGFNVSGTEVTLSLKGKNVKSIDRFIGAYASATNDKGDNIFKNVVVSGYNKKDAQEVDFEAKFNLNEAALW